MTLWCFRLKQFRNVYFLSNKGWLKLIIWHFTILKDNFTVSNCVFLKILLIDMGSKYNSLIISKHGPSIDYSAIQSVKFHYYNIHMLSV